MVRRCVWSRNLVNEEALAHWGLSRQKKNKQKYLYPKNTNYRRRNVTLHVEAQDVKSDCRLGRNPVLSFTWLDLSGQDGLKLALCTSSACSRTCIYYETSFLHSPPTSALRTQHTSINSSFDKLTSHSTHARSQGCASGCNSPTSNLQNIKRQTY